MPPRPDWQVEASYSQLIHMLLNLWSRYFENEWWDFDTNWHEWSTGQGHDTVNFGVRSSKVKVKWRRRPGGGILLDPLGSSRFCHATLCIVQRSMSSCGVRLSVHLWNLCIVVKSVNVLWNFFHSLVHPSFSFFHRAYQMLWQYSDGTHPRNWGHGLQVAYEKIAIFDQ